MALTSFRIENQRSLRLAEATSVPSVMVIAGPNGVGKSTLLYAIKSQQGTVMDGATRILYQAPHRVLRRTSIQRRWLGGVIPSFRDLLAGDSVPGHEGLNFQNPARTPENVDEAGSTLKHTLGKIENRRQTLLAKAVDRSRKLGEDMGTATLPDIYAPLQRLTEHLLPHLRFESIDFTNEDDIKCQWERTSPEGPVLIDIDQLSSGEKAIIVLFLPLLEDQIQSLFQQLERYVETGNITDEPIVTEERLILIDEPEQHLHPDLQAKILGYMRTLTHETPTRFIITTHSPTILDQAFDTELFVLSEPVGNPVENQLRQIATNSERLEALKQLTGSAYFFTTGRVIVCIEGERDSDPEKPTDARLLSILYPRATAVTLVPTTGKGNVITTVERLREHVPEATFRIRVRGLVDADQSTATVAGVETLPVCMIENLLLVPEGLYQYLQSVGITTFADVEAVRVELKRIAASFRDSEIGLRIQRRLKPQMIRLKGATVDEVKESYAAALTQVESSLPNDADLASLVSEVTGVVDNLIDTNAELDQFRGKKILEAFHTQHLAPIHIGYNSMCIEVAKIVATDDSVSTKLDPVFDRLLNS
ncbi:MAG: ATP-binding protein [Candidatus Pacebacteria bacterium]|nr:ATP-binding protein [Candidatus Paceibacterota bacterium]